jgi:hypothetical protein
VEVRPARRIEVGDSAAEATSAVVLRAPVAHVEPPAWEVVAAVVEAEEGVDNEMVERVKGNEIEK